MKYKIRYKYKEPLVNSFTFIELIVVASVVSTLAITLFMNLYPLENKQKFRDNSRLANIAEIERVVNEYFLDYGNYPGDPDILYVSDFTNWIPISDVTEYISRLPIDPLNKNTSKYYYIHNNDSYEINATLEFFTDMMQKDNGDSSQKYEVGNNLTLIPNN